MMEQFKIDLNADLGEGAPFDVELLGIVSSANIACGGHAGDEGLMQKTVQASVRNTVRIGAHPSYSDRQNFGRVSIPQPIEKTLDDVVKQIRVLSRVANSCGTNISYVKPHGALYNDSALRDDLAIGLYTALADNFEIDAVMGLPNTAHQRAAKHVGLRFIAEAFVDRAYTENGLLKSRTEKGAVHETEAKIVQQALMFAQQLPLVIGQTKIGQTKLQLHAQSLCLHGDTPNALKSAQAIKAAFLDKNIEISAG